MKPHPALRRAPLLRAKCIDARTHADHLLARLQEDLYPTEEWAFGTEVRNTVGISGEVRYFDGIAVDYRSVHELRIHGFEVKTSRADFLHEMKHPEKRAPVIDLRVPCYGCLERRPVDFAYLEAALLDLERPDRDRLITLLLGRRGAEPGGAA